MTRQVVDVWHAAGSCMTRRMVDVYHLLGDAVDPWFAMVHGGCVLCALSAHTTPNDAIPYYNWRNTLRGLKTTSFGAVFLKYPV